MDRKTLDQIADLPEEARLLFAAGLAKLSEDLTGRHPLLATIEVITPSLVGSTVLAEVPEHIEFDVAELQEMLSYLSESTYWTIYWEFGEDNSFDLIGEIGLGNGGVSVFTLASGLEGQRGLDLASEDGRFVERIRSYVRLWQPTTTDELFVVPVELPISWAAHESVIDNVFRLESYLQGVIEGSTVSGTMARGAYVDVHTNKALDEAEYAGVTTLAIDTRKNIAALPRVVSDYEDSLVSGPAHTA